MEWLNHILVPFEALRSVTGGSDKPGVVFLKCLTAYTFLVFLSAVFGHLILRHVASNIQQCAMRLAAGARVQNVIRLEAGSASIERRVRWLATSFIFVPYSAEHQDDRLPGSRRDSSFSQFFRLCFRSGWLMIHHILVFIGTLPRLLLRVLGVTVLLASILSAFPESVRVVAIALASFLSEMTWPKATLVAFLPVAVLVGRLLVSPRKSAHRTFRRERAVKALNELYGALQPINALACAVETHVYETVRVFEAEKLLALEWYRRATCETPQYNTRIYDRDAHVVCDEACLGDIDLPIRFKEYSSEVEEAVAAVQEVWNEKVAKEMPVLADLSNWREWDALKALASCFSRSGEFLWHKIPPNDYWRQHRIVWQHRLLVSRELLESDMAAGRRNAAILAQDSNDQWLDTVFHHVIWNLIGLSRTLSDLKELAWKLSRSTRRERFARLLEN